MLYRYRKYEPNEFYVVGVDTSAGGSDFTAVQFLSKTKLDVPSVLHDKTSITAITPLIHLELEKIYDATGVQPVVAYERQNGGLFELERLGTLNRNGKYRIFTMPTYGSVDNPESNKIGWDTNTATRPKMLQDLREAINKQLLKLYHKTTVNELFTFIINKQGKPEAEKHSHDDLVMALAIAWQLYQTENPPQEIRPEDLPRYEPSDPKIGI
jgi:hypothetical protein